MKISVFTLLLICLFSVTTLSYAQSAGNLSVTCDDGTTFDNGVVFTVHKMRPGFPYTATAIGLNGFDPVLAVLDETGEGLCNDDSDAAAAFTLDLPTTGAVRGSERSAQVSFEQTTEDMADVSLVVGGFNNEPGEFVLIVEGMAATAIDGAGDPFSVHLSPDLVASGVPLTTYMFSVADGLDALLYLADENLEPITDDAGDLVVCDDAGSNSCWGDSVNLGGSFVSRTQSRFARGDALDSMLQLSLDGFQDMDFSEDLSLTYIMTRATEGSGDYVIAVHASTITDENVDEVSENNDQAAATAEGTRNLDSIGGVTLTCDDGTSIENGVEFVVNQMRPGFSYTATVLGIDEFDPVLAVVGPDGRAVCNDDSDGALEFFANLPSTGEIFADARSAQLEFSQMTNDMADVSLVVGGFNGEPGQFLLIVEGLATTVEDGQGDPFSVQITPGLVTSDIPVTAYMFGVVDAVDPVMFVADADLEPFVDDAGDPVLCDDGGNASLCWGESSSLEGTSLARSRGRTTSGDATDAMLTIPLTDFADLEFGDGPYYLTIVMSRYENSGVGDYVIAFHAAAP